MKSLIRPETEKGLYKEKGKNIPIKRLEKYVEEIDLALEKQQQAKELSEFMSEI